MNITAKDILSQAIKSARECQRSASVSCLMGQGWTVGYGKSSLIHKVGKEGKFNFSASWNRGSVYWDRKHATKVLNEIGKRPEFAGKLVLIHHDDARSECLANALSTIAAVFPNRHMQF